MSAETPPQFATRARAFGVLLLIPVLMMGDTLFHYHGSARIYAMLALLMLGVYVSVELARRGIRKLALPERLVATVECTIALYWLLAVEPMKVLEHKPVWIVAVVGGAVLAQASVFAKRFRRLDAVGTSALLAAVLYLHLHKEPTMIASLHAAGMFLAASLTSRLAELLVSTKELTSRTTALVAGCSLVVAHVLLALSPALRYETFVVSPHGSPITSPVGMLADFDWDGASPLLGGVDCALFDAARGPFAVDVPGDGIDQDCDGTDAPTHRATPSVRSRLDADVLFLTIDALRTDASSLLVGTRRAVGPLTEFRNAVSPAPRTAHSFASSLRGVPLSALPYDRRLFRAPIESSAPPTLGARLAGHGYRSVYVASHAYLEAAPGVVTGFERVGPAVSELAPDAYEMVPSDDALAALLESARTTPGPLFAWAHLMESHVPYRRGPGQLTSDDLAGYRAAVTSVDARIERFVPRFREARRLRPLVVVIFGDHGEAFREHAVRGHSSSVQFEQVRVPLLLAFDGVRRVVDAPTTLATVPATVLDVLGLPVPTELVPSVVACATDGRDCPKEARTDMASSTRAGAVALRGHTAGTRRCLVDRAHDVGAVYDTVLDPRERRPTPMPAAQAVAACSSDAEYR